MRQHSRPSLAWTLTGLGLIVALTACSSSSQPADDSRPSGGSVTGTAGASSNGGSNASGGTSASAGAGGVPGTAGLTSFGGSSVAGAAGGAVTMTGGSGGAAGSTSGSAGSSAGGAAPACTPGGTGTMEIAPGVLRDLKTCLDWEENPTTLGKENWVPSNQYCNDLVLGGFDDWRMPTNAEIASTPVMFVNHRLDTTPRFVPTGTTDPSLDFHYCGVAQWDVNNPRVCQWVGQGNIDGTICVRGETTIALAPPDDCPCVSGESGFVPWQD